MSILFAGTSPSRVTTNNKAQVSAITATGQFTICFWAYPTAIGANNYCVSSGNVGTGPIVLGFTTTQKVISRVSSANSTSATSSISLNTWVHIAVTYNSLTDQIMNLYINGVLAAGQANNAGTLPFPATPTSFVMGGFNGGGNNYTGRLAEVCIFNRALAASEIAQIAATLDGLDPSFTGWLNLIAYYHLNGQTATEVDSSGNVANVGFPASVSYAVDSPGYSFAAGKPVSTLVSNGVSVPVTIDSGVTFQNPA